MIDKSNLIVFPRLSQDIDNAVSGTARRILIVTPDIEGPTKSSGDGSPYYHAANELSSKGHDVTLLHSMERYSTHKELDLLIEQYRNKNIKFIPCPDPEVAPTPGVMGECCSIQYRVYEWLKKHEDDFDVVHGSECGANLYFCLLAKETGFRFTHLNFVIKASSPLLWNKLGNNDPIKSFMDLPRIFMERRCIELADKVVSGSNYMLNWMNQAGYQLNREQCFVHPNIFPIIPKSDRSTFIDSHLKELVFFGRLERRKGVDIYLDAITRTLKKLGRDSLDHIIFTFLGKFRDDYDARAAINSTFQSAGLKYKIISDCGQPEALGYLKGRDGILAIIPSVIDNSPVGVYELLGYGVPFITSNAGGGKELIHHEEWNRVLFDPHPFSIQLKLEELLGSIITPVRPSFDMEENLHIWDEWHRYLPVIRSVDNSVYPVNTKTKLNGSKSTKYPLVSICLAHFNRPTELSQAIESIKNLEYKNFELIIVDDGSTSPEAQAYLETLKTTDFHFPVRILTQPNLYIGASRNLAASNAHGEYLLFMDDDNLAKPHELKVMVKLAENSGVDILTCFADLFVEGTNPQCATNENSRVLFIGPDLGSGLIRNPFGDSNCLVRKKTFFELGGFTEHYKVGRDDQEFFAKAIIHGARLTVVPEALYWYRISKKRIKDNHFSSIAGFQRVSETYIKQLGLSPELGNILRLAQGVSTGKSELYGSRFSQFIQGNMARRVAYRYPVLVRIFWPLLKRLV